MKLNSKRIGVGLITALAVLALSVAAAPAAEFHSEAVHTILKGNQVGEAVFTVNAGTVKCKEASTEDTGEHATEKVVTGGNATISGCTAFGFINATVDLNGCEIEASASTNEVNIVNCVSPGVFTAFNCWITISNQAGLKSVTYTNTGSGSGRYLIGHSNITAIKYTQDSKSFPGCTTGTFTNGVLTGEGILKGFNTAKEPVGIWKE